MNFIKSIAGYLLGFVALATFAAVSFGNGAPDVSSWRQAFLVGGAVGAIELCVLWVLPKPANRLVIAANGYLAVGGLAFALKQWWLLQSYEKLGLSGILLAMLCVGFAITFGSKAGFVGMNAPQDLVRKASYVLIGFVVLAVTCAQALPAREKGAGVIMITILAFAYRAMRNWVSRQQRKAKLEEKLG